MIVFILGRLLYIQDWLDNLLKRISKNSSESWFDWLITIFFRRNIPDLMLIVRLFFFCEEVDKPPLHLQGECEPLGEQTQHSSKIPGKHILLYFF